MKCFVFHNTWQYIYVIQFILECGHSGGFHHPLFFSIHYSSYYAWASVSLERVYQYINILAGVWEKNHNIQILISLKNEHYGLFEPWRHKAVCKSALNKFNNKYTLPYHVLWHDNLNEIKNLNKGNYKN